MDDKTTRDEIDIDLDGTINHAIKELERLKKLYPKGKIWLTSDTEYGETYPRLRLEFTRPKTAIEIELAEWRDKLGRYSQLATAAQAYEREGDVYPRAEELIALKSELGCFTDRMTSLVIHGDEILAWGFDGARTRDGQWRMRTMFSIEREQREQSAIDPANA